MTFRWRRRTYTLAAAAAVLLVLGLLLLLRFHAPPEVARLLPESDAIVYLNLKPLRAALHLEQQPVEPAPEYAHFLTETGFQWDRDLDRVAVSLHRMPDPGGPNGPVAYTGVLEGHFDTERLRRYLQANSTARQTYAGHEVYTLAGNDGRVLQVCVLGYDLLAASNVPGTEQIHSVIDRHAAGASPFAGSSLLSLRYRQVPYFAFAWGIGHVGLPFSERGHIQVFGVTLPLSEDTDFIVSLTFRGALRFRAEELTPSEAEAARSATNLSTIVNLLRGFMPSGGSAANQALLEALQSLTVQQQKTAVVLTGSLSPVLLRPARPQP